MSFSRRRLPPVHPPAKWLFLTWHLEGSLPHALFPPPGKQSNGEACDEAAVSSIRWLDGPLSQHNANRSADPMREIGTFGHKFHPKGRRARSLLTARLGHYGEACSRAGESLSRAVVGVHPTKYRWSSAGKSVETILDAADTSVRATQAQANSSLSKRCVEK